MEKSCVAITISMGREKMNNRVNYESEIKKIQCERSENSEKASLGFEKLYAVVEKLRCPEGCPWDREQTPTSMRSDLIEECFETVDAISQNDSFHAKEELGDVFLNAAMISYMYEQNGDFTVASVLDEVVEKIIRRHPHVWKDSEGSVNANETKATTSAEVLSQWDNIKRGVEGRKEKSVVDEVSEGLPPLMRAYKIQKKAAKKGFDWDSLEPVWEKITEEMSELHCAVEEESNVEEEVGDLLFAVVNLARKLKVDPTVALASANRKFRNRFVYVEEMCQKNNISMESGNLEIMDKFWDEAKNFEKN